jgi:hypothetical protein
MNAMNAHRAATSATADQITKMDISIIPRTYTLSSREGQK